MSERPVEKSLYKNYLKKAEEMLEEAKHAQENSRNNAAVVASIHPAINSLDSLSVFYFGRRHKGDHESILEGIKGILEKNELLDISRQFGNLMALKNEAEYQPRLMSSQDANAAVKGASRIMSKVKEKLPAE